MYYTYLISSLPMLHFGAKPPFAFEKFLQICQPHISDRDIEVLRTAPQIGESAYDNKYAALKKWHKFDTIFRNELVKLRAPHRGINPAKYLRQDSDVDPYIIHIAKNSHRNPSILNAERVLDEERWRRLDELTAGHYFDMDFLIIYAHKLLILERWERIGTADREKVLEESIREEPSIKRD